MNDTQEKPRRNAWNTLFYVVVVIGGFFALLGPCLYFRGFTESDPEYRLEQTRESPDGEFFADAHHYRSPGKEEETAIIVEIRRSGTELKKGRRVFVSDVDLFVDHFWTDPKTLTVEYRVSGDGRKPDRMVPAIWGIDVKFRFIR